MRDFRMQTLFEAIYNNDIKYVKNNLRSIKNINQSDEKQGKTALELACELDRCKILKVLWCREDADIYAKNNKKRTLLDICIENDSFNCAQLLATELLTNCCVGFNFNSFFRHDKIAVTANTQEVGIQDLFKAIIDNNIKYIEDNLNYIQNINQPYHCITVLELACKLDRCLILKLLIGRKDADINTKSNGKLTLLDICIQNDSFDCAQLLLGAGISTLTDTPVHDYIDTRPYEDLTTRHPHNWLALLLAYDCKFSNLHIDPKQNRSCLGTHENKRELFSAMKGLHEPARSLSLEKAINNQTQLGKVFYFKNGFFAPDCSRKDCTLYDIAEERNKSYKQQKQNSAHILNRVPVTEGSSLKIQTSGQNSFVELDDSAVSSNYEC